MEYSMMKNLLCVGFTALLRHHEFGDTHSSAKSSQLGDFQNAIKLIQSLWQSATFPNQCA